MKTKQTLRVRSQKEIADGIFDLRLQYTDRDRIPDNVLPGQFVNVYPRDASALLPRPISICGFERQEGILRLVYRRVGKGTAEFSRLAEGDFLDVLGILGNGYDPAVLAGRNVLLIGGGIGAPPLLGLAKRLAAQERQEGKGSVTSVLGYRTDDLFLKEEFEACGRVIAATDDGTAGFHGNVVSAAAAVFPAGGSIDAVCACGPLPMLRGVKQLARKLGAACYVSLEERMACGVGACLGCVTRTTGTDEHSHVRNARVCTEGPVFNAEEVEL